MEIKATFPETEEKKEQQEFESQVITPTIRVISKKEGTALENNEMAKLGMFRVYRKDGDLFLGHPLKAVPLFWAPFEIKNTYTKGQPPFAVSIYDLTTSLRWFDAEKQYKAGDTVRNLDKYESGALVFLLLEDGSVEKMFLKKVNLEKFKEYTNKVKPFTVTSIDSKKVSTDKGSFYGLEFEEAKSQEEIVSKSRLKELVEEVKAKVETQVKLQRGEEE